MSVRPHRQRWRAISFALALLLLGAASAVGIAWFAAGVGSLRIRSWTILEWNESGAGRKVNDWVIHAAGDWSRRAWRVAPTTVTHQIPESALPPIPPDWVRAWRPASAAEWDRSWFEMEFGWPVPWLVTSFEDARYERLVDRADLIERGIAITPFWFNADLSPPVQGLDMSMREDPVRSSALPMGVLALQGAASIGFWCGAWLILFALLMMPTRLARRRRSKRNRCRFCRHDLTPRVDSGIDRRACPECGRSQDERVPLFGRGVVVTAWTLAIALAAADLIWAWILVSRYEPPPLLHRAASHGDLAAIERELARGEPVDLLDQGRIRPPATALMYAASAGQAGAVKRLLAAGANPNAPAEYFDSSSTGLPPLVWAANGGSTEALAAIADAGAAFDPELRSFGGALIGEVAIGRACEAGKRDAVAWLAARDPAVCLPTEKYWWGGDSEAMRASSAGRDPEILRLVLDAYEKRFGSREALCAKFAKHWKTLHARAAYAGRLENLKILMARCSCEECLAGIVDGALGFGQRQFVIDLIRDGWRFEGTNETVIGEALSVRMPDLIPMFLEAGADPNACRHLGYEHPLVIALKHDDLENAMVLIRAGAVLDRDPDVWCEALKAINWSKSKPPLVEAILGRLPSIDHRTETQVTALMAAARAGSVEWVKWLLERGADPAAISGEGRTVRDYASDPKFGTSNECLPLMNEPDDAAADGAARRAVLELLDRAIGR